MFAAVALALTLTLLLTFTFDTVPRAHALAAITTTERTRTRTGDTSVFFILVSEGFTLTREVINWGLKGKVDRIAANSLQDNGPCTITTNTQNKIDLFVSLCPGG